MSLLDPSEWLLFHPSWRQKTYPFVSILFFYVRSDEFHLLFDARINSEDTLGSFSNLIDYAWMADWLAQMRQIKQNS